MRNPYREANVDPLLSLLSYAILFGGACTIAVAVYTTLVSYSSLPWWDTWEYIAAIANGEGPLSPRWLWRQHNEHRLVIQKLFFAVDLEMFHARQVFLLSSIIVIQLLHVCLWGWSMRVLGGWRGALWRSGVGLVAFCIFCPSAWLNYTMGFQVCYILLLLFVTLSFVALLLYWRDSQRHAGRASSRSLWLCILAAVCATFSLSNGNLLWPLLLAAALLLRLRRPALLTIAIAGAITISLYFYSYVRPSYHADPLAALTKPFVVMKFVAVYFGSSWVHDSVAIATVIGGVGLIIAVIVLLRTLYYVRTSRAFALQIVITVAFLLGTAFVTAAGRLNFGVPMAFQSRYQTFALLFWCSLGLLLLNYTSSDDGKDYRVLAQICVLLIMVRGAVLSSRPIQEARAHGFGLNVAITAVLTGVDEPTLFAQVAEHRDKLLLGINYLREHQLSLFSDWNAHLLGKPLDKDFGVVAASECAGKLEFVIPRNYGSPGLYVAGWAWDRQHHQPARAILAASHETVTGLAAVGHLSTTAKADDRAVNSLYAGFAGYIRQPEPGSEVKVYAILNHNPPSICYFGSIDEEFNTIK